MLVTHNHSILVITKTPSLTCTANFLCFNLHNNINTLTKEVSLMNLSKIQVRINQCGSKKVKQIELFLGDLLFTADVCSERDISLAQRLADENNIILYRIDLEQ